MSTQPVPAVYPSLRNEILGILQAGKERARLAVEREKAQTYWEVGRILHEHLLAHKDRADYGKQAAAREALEASLNSGGRSATPWGWCRA